MTTITQPPRYYAEAWAGGNCTIAPWGYDGIQFDFGVVERQICQIDDKHVSIMGNVLWASNTQFEVSDPDYPIYFEVSGGRYHYVFSIWSNRVEIEVCTLGPRFERLSCMFPQTQAQFLNALSTVVEDYLVRLLR